MSQARARPFDHGGFCLGWCSGRQQGLQTGRAEHALVVTGCGLAGCHHRRRQELQGAPHSGSGLGSARSWHCWLLLTQEDGQQINHSIAPGRISPSLHSSVPFDYIDQRLQERQSFISKRICAQGTVAIQGGFTVFFFPLGPPQNAGSKQPAIRSS